MNDISKKLKRLRNEDFIWIVYFFIVVFALYSNKLDRDYLLKKDNEAYKREKYINITIFFIAFFIYLYFLLLLTEDLGSMGKNFNDPVYRSTFIQLIAAILFLIGGAIYLINEITRKDDALDVGLI
jgi:quinol-cytochrome oxidoreductase complex cytochrome b subunit